MTTRRARKHNSTEEKRREAQDVPDAGGHVIDLTSKPPTRPDLVRDVSISFPLRKMVPVAALLEAAVVIGLFAALLYSIPPDAALWVSVAVGAGIVLATVLASMYRTFTGAIFGRVAMLTVYPLAIAVVFVNLAKLGGGEGEPAARSEAPGGGAEISLAADNLSFGTERLEIPAGSSTTVHFANRDTALHNLSIYETPDADENLFEGEIIAGGKSIDYVIEGLAPGRYYFRCDVHPTMDGRAVVGRQP